MRCPCCSQPTERVDPLWLGPYLKLTGHDSVIYELLAQNFGKPVSSDRVLDRMYRDYPDGGPGTARKVMHLRVSTLRKVLRPHDLAIWSSWGGHLRGRLDADGAWYALQWATEEAEAVDMATLRSVAA